MEKDNPNSFFDNEWSRKPPNGGASWAAIAGTDLLAPPGRFRLTQRADGSALDLLFQPIGERDEAMGAATVATITLG